MPGNVAGELTRDKASVAHDDHLVGDALDFVKLVRDVKHRHTSRIQLGDQLKQTFGLAGG
jgi:hypothetical protein